VETGLQVTTYVTDNGELKSHEMAQWLASWGTDHQFTAPYTSAHIRPVERMHYTLLAKACTKCIYANLPVSFWDEFYNSFIYSHQNYDKVSCRQNSMGTMVWTTTRLLLHARNWLLGICLNIK
jgi:hypothetical protein